MAVAAFAGARAVACPQACGAGLKERIALAFKGRDAGNVADGEAGLLEPAAKVRLLALALRVVEAAERDGVAVNKAGVGSKDHVGRAGLRLDEMDIGYLSECGMERGPLVGGALARRTVYA